LHAHYPLSDTFAGIAPAGVSAFIVAQLIGATVGMLLARWLWTDKA
jgi:glycerol uptake facilitator-like aquaporin